MLCQTGKGGVGREVGVTGNIINAVLSTGEFCTAKTVGKTVVAKAVATTGGWALLRAEDAVTGVAYFDNHPCPRAGSYPEFLRS